MGIFTRMYPKTPKEYQELVRVLDELNIEHFVFPEKNAALLMVDIRGLPLDMDTTLITEELSKKYPVIKVAQMTIFKTAQKHPLYQVQLTDGPAAKEIFKLDNLFYNIINIGYYNLPPPSRDAML